MVIITALDTGSEGEFDQEIAVDAEVNVPLELIAVTIGATMLLIGDDAIAAADDVAVDTGAMVVDAPESLESTRNDDAELVDEDFDGDGGGVLLLVSATSRSKSVFVALVNLDESRRPFSQVARSSSCCR